MSKKYQKILVMGLSGVGKTYLASRLAKLIDAAHLNADIIRKEYDDWDFSDEGRIRQSKRMLDLAIQKVKSQHVIADFICPKSETREIFDADYLIWVNTKTSSEYPDTDKIFEKPKNIDFEVKSFGHGEIYAQLIAKQILNKTWNNQAPTVQLLGRWQPWHQGHRALFDRAFGKTGQVCIMLRDIEDKENPFSFKERVGFIEENLSDTYVLDRDYVVLSVPNIVNITYGRKVGYAIKQEVFDEKTHEISASKIRATLK